MFGMFSKTMFSNENGDFQLGPDLVTAGGDAEGGAVDTGASYHITRVRVSVRVRDGLGLWQERRATPCSLQEGMSSIWTTLFTSDGWNRFLQIMWVRFVYAIHTTRLFYCTASDFIWPRYRKKYLSIWNSNLFWFLRPILTRKVISVFSYGERVLSIYLNTVLPIAIKFGTDITVQTSGFF